MSEVLKLTDLIAKAEDIKKRKKARKEVFIESLGGNIVLEEPDKADIMSAFDMDGGAGDSYIVYRCIVDPDLTDAGLKKAFGAADPVDLVNKLFPKSGERAQLAKLCMALAGYNNDAVKVVKDIKN